MSDGMGRELTYLSSHATNRYFIPNWGNTCSSTRALPGSSDSCRSSTDKTMTTLSWQYRLLVLLGDAMDSEKIGGELAESEEDLLEHRTDGTDAFDTLNIGCEKFPQADIPYVDVDVNGVV